MVKFTETYEDFNGNSRTEDCYFNLTEAEVLKLQLGELGGLSVLLERIIMAQDTPTIVKVFEELLQKSYGVKTADGRGFQKSPEILNDFIATQAYSNIFTRLATNDAEASAFINKLIPPEMVKSIIAKKEAADKAAAAQQQNSNSNTNVTPIHQA